MAEGQAAAAAVAAEGSSKSGFPTCVRISRYTPSPPISHYLFYHQ
jgi:hypothetical protein